MRGLAAAQRPKAPSTWSHVDGARRGGCRDEVVARARIHVARLRADDRRTVRPRCEHARSSVVSIEPSARAGTRSRPRRGRGGGCCGRWSRDACPDDDPNPRSLEQPVAPDVPPGTVQHLPTAGGSKADGVLLSARDEPDRRRGGRCNSSSATGRRCLRRQHRRRQGLVVGSLIPPDRQHVRNEGGVDRATGHEP